MSTLPKMSTKYRKERINTMSKLRAIFSSAVIFKVLTSFEKVLQKTIFNMSLKCRFSNCQWSGLENEIFEHFESVHKKFLREPKGKTYFDFNLNDLQQEAFVLCSTEGLYWFRRNIHKRRSNGFDFGLFHIGESKRIQYTLKLGLKRDNHCEYWGPLPSEDEHLQNPEQEEYDLNFDYLFLQVINETMPSRRLRLYFGEFDDSDDKICPEPADMLWAEEDERVNRLAIERFTCGVCLEYIRRDARFCENQHFICLNCFDEMLMRKRLKCPTCRGQYLYDCSDDSVERILRMIKWPDMKVDNEAFIKEYEELLKTGAVVKKVEVDEEDNF